MTAAETAAPNPLLFDGQVVLASADDASPQARALLRIAEEALAKPEVEFGGGIEHAAAVLQEIRQTLQQAASIAQAVIDEAVINESAALDIFASLVMVRLLEWAYQRMGQMIGRPNDAPRLFLPFVRGAIAFSARCEGAVVAGPLGESVQRCRAALPTLRAERDRLTARVAESAAFLEAQNEEPPWFSEWPRSCQAGPAPDTREALDRDPRDPPTLLIVGDLSPSVLMMIRNHIRAVAGVPLVPAPELAAAEQLRAANRLSPTRTCGRSPSLERILQQTYPNLIVADAFYQCRRRECRLRVIPRDTSLTSLPEEYRAAAPEPAPPETLIPQLAPAETYFEALGVRGTLQGRRFVARTLSPSDPWLDLRHVLQDSGSELNACATRNVLQVDILLQVDGSGRVTRAEISGAPDADTEGCLVETLSELRFPCLESEDANLSLNLCLAPAP
ncbi:MAG: hypothetical protein AAGE52_25375 [Myxococcota bacterium]